MVIVCRKYIVQISGMLVHIKLKKSKEMNVLVVIIDKFADTRRLRDPKGTDGSSEAMRSETCESDFASPNYQQPILVHGFILSEIKGLFFLFLIIFFFFFFLRG